MAGPGKFLKRFLCDERGAFAPIFAVMAITLIALGGAVVDYVRVDAARTETQIALDAAALALQPDIYTDSDATLKQNAQDFLSVRLHDPAVTVTVDDVSTDTTEGTLYLHADTTLSMTFLELVGIRHMTVGVVSEATRKKLHLEVAFVLDNSGSMANYDRMTNLKSAAVCATKILFYGSCDADMGTEEPADNVQIGVVPFTIFVNVGTEHINDTWLDQNGLSSIADENFDGPLPNPGGRFALYDQISNVSWKGCVEERPYPLSVNDTPPDTSNPDTLFEPEFAPDEPDYGGYYTTYYNSYLNDSGGSCTSVRCHYYGQHGGCYCSHGYPCTYPELTDREKQERLCKYDGASASSSYGPNQNCLSTKILPLTPTPSTIITRINSMVANGGTNIHAGAIWGFRVLSPGAPYTEGRDYDTATSKVMILMTDGANTYYTSSNMNKAAYYYPFGYLWNVQNDATRLGTSSLYSASDVEEQMDTLTVQSCQAAKNAGIEVYAIGLSPPNTSTRTMLTNCASGSDHAYFPTDSSQLNSVFEEIALKLADLRLQR